MLSTSVTELATIQTLHFKDSRERHIASSQQSSLLRSPPRQGCTTSSRASSCSSPHSRRRASSPVMHMIYSPVLRMRLHDDDSPCGSYCSWWPEDDSGRCAVLHSTWTPRDGTATCTPRELVLKRARAERPRTDREAQRSASCPPAQGRHCAQLRVIGGKKHARRSLPGPVACTADDTRPTDGLASCKVIVLDAMGMKLSPRPFVTASRPDDQHHQKMVQLVSSDWPLACVPLAFGIIISDLWDSFCSWLPTPLLVHSADAS
mmetsp:Transcript_15891/g.29052  ORF Transcript_15891/g.29052 Transcript_15891/m.29052 type:complete len:262 (-) Transcript_15891:27-812(-)